MALDPDPVQHDRAGLFGRVAQAAPAAVVLALFAAMPVTAAEIGFTCRAETAVSAADHAMICDEFLAALATAHPGHSFAQGQAAPGVELTITHAGERGLGLGILWTAPDGRQTTGTPLSVSYYDRPANPKMRARFYAKFLTQNPPPF